MVIHDLVMRTSRITAGTFDEQHQPSNDKQRSLSSSPRLLQVAVTAPGALVNFTGFRSIEPAETLPMGPVLARRTHLLQLVHTNTSIHLQRTLIICSRAGNQDSLIQEFVGGQIALRRIPTHDSHRANERAARMPPVRVIGVVPRVLGHEPAVE